MNYPLKVSPTCFDEWNTSWCYVPNLSTWQVVTSLSEGLSTIYFLDIEGNKYYEIICEHALYREW